MTEKKRILVATDFSRASHAAVRAAFRLARETNSSVLIAHVLEVPIPMAEGYILPRIYDDIARAVQDQASGKMKRMLALARRAGVSARGLLLRGAPHEAIVRAARVHGVDQIVMGTHGRSGFSRLLVGSVAARVIAAASKPTLVVPPSRRMKRAA